MASKTTAVPAAMDAGAPRTLGIAVISSRNAARHSCPPRAVKWTPANSSTEKPSAIDNRNQSSRLKNWKLAEANQSPQILVAVQRIAGSAVGRIRRARAYEA